MSAGTFLSAAGTTDTAKKLALPKLAMVAGLALLVAACAQPTPYKPRLDSSTGFSEQQIEGNRFRVTFYGNDVTPRETVENYLLYRAAELTLQRDGDHFVLVEKDIERITDYHGNAGWPGGYSVYGSRWPGSYGYGMGWSTNSYAQNRYRAYADILIFKGRTPKDDPKSYDARTVIEQLGPTVRYPQPR
ncbi:MULTISPECIES: YgdI/YgdR family lipoprotein [Oceanibaculum]|uniref:Lipoprotein n=1 Tax=Oceanibaculum indicum TaxID=526216 RepID=A0A420WN59_9PROT|nr:MULTISPECIES: YgdI/YgdR family lipoprotein [Oceanibaculum]MCH2393784.1 YgdI/YgdR family lipoprotein [Oceanibaculum sp.]RKQ72447.1 hypothetical protein BCL74_0213 [Oceanibaculum indicum]